LKTEILSGANPQSLDDKELGYEMKTPGSEPGETFP
jgi:hypothetical protein